MNYYNPVEDQYYQDKSVETVQKQLFTVLARLPGATFDVYLKEDGYILVRTHPDGLFVLSTARTKDSPRYFKSLDSIVSFISSVRDDAFIRLHLHDLTVLQLQV